MKPPSRLSKRCKSLVFCEFRKQYESIVVVFDGEKNMYTTQALPITDELSSVVSLPRPGGRSGSDQFLILVRKVAELKSNDQQAMVQALDIAIRQACSRGRQTIGRLLFEQVQCDQRLDPGIVIGEGLFTSLRIGEAGAFINVDVVRAAFYNEAEDLALLAKHLLFKDRVRPERVQSLNERQVENVRGFFCGMPICVKHLTYRPKMTVVHVTEETAEEKQFDYGNESITVANYFNRKYKPQLAYPKLPCIDVGGNCYYPMEKCFPIKFGKCVQILKEFTLDKGTREYMLMTPQVKLGTAKNAVNQKMDKSLLQSFFKDLPESPYELKARRLTDFPTETGSTVPLTVQYWVIANACKNAPLACNQLNIFRDTLVNEGKKLNVHLSEHWDSRDFSQSNPRSMLEDLSRKSRRPDIVFVILDKNSPRYNSIKYYAETKFGFITQCVTKANFCKSQQQLVSVLSNVMRKVKAKMGGAEKVMKGGVGAFRFDHVMVMGADVSHPGPKEKGKPSVAAIVASIDERASRYVATFRVQAQDPATRRRVEIIQDMENVAKDLLRTYKEETGAEPEKIIFYRDGVSEGQFSQVQQSELRALRAACDDVLQERPAITLLTVQKRHRTRFVRRREHLNVEQGTVVDTGHGTRFVRREHLNVEQGTVVDTGITHPRDFDFYLCSHHSPLGTARPAHYYVLWDEIGFTSDELQLLTYGLCNVYARCKTAVSIPAPVYYAHHAATRASCYLQVEGQAHGNTFRLSQHVKSKMFFI
ncbi:protein argonaute-3-like [Amblyomma americanum]